MRKKVFVVVFLIALVFLVPVSFIIGWFHGDDSAQHVFHKQTKYAASQETSVSFGDGTFQIQSRGGSKVLMDMGMEKEILANVKDYKESSTKSAVFVAGSGKYVVMYLDTDQYFLYDSLQKVPIEVKEFFRL